MTYIVTITSYLKYTQDIEVVANSQSEAHDYAIEHAEVCQDEIFQLGNWSFDVENIKLTDTENQK